MLSDAWIDKIHTFKYFYQVNNVFSVNNSGEKPDH